MFKIENNVNFIKTGFFCNKAVCACVIINKNITSQNSQVIRYLCICIDIEKL